MEEWRLLDVETPDRAAVNLAIDEAVFLEKIENKVPPTARFWRNRCAVVIGYSQKVGAEVNLELCRDVGIEIVRRFSGGGAVYHDLGNLNYSIALEADHRLIEGLDIGESYRVLCSGIIEGVKEFGVDLVLDPPSDLLAQNRKISGNAQSRKKGTVFHHGTLLVNSDLKMLDKLLIAVENGSKIKGAASNKRPVTNLADETSCIVDTGKVKEALKRGFEEAFSVRLVEGTLTLREKNAAKSLYTRKYSKKEWNFQR